MRRKIRWKWLLTAAILTTAASGLILFAAAQFFLSTEKMLPRADAIFVLSGSQEYVARTAKAAELFDDGIADKIILTRDNGRAGWSNQDRRNLFYYELAQRELIKHKVPPERIEVLPEPVAGTNDEMLLLAQTVETRKMQSVLLVTSEYHTARTFRTANRILRRENVTLDLGITAPPESSAWWFEWKNQKTIALEYLKTVYYWLFY